MTAPLVPPEVDLSGYEYMPLYGHKLLSSDFNAGVSDAGFRAGVNLWWAAWNQVPAASLPNIDVVLTGLAGIGRGPRAVKEFMSIKAEALHGFVLCDDGRLYHRQLAVWALEAWDRRVKERERKARWRGGKHRDADVPETGTETGHQAGQTMGQNGPVPVEVKRSEAKRSDIENREVGVTPTDTARANGSHPAIENTGNSTAKTVSELWWKTPKGVAATAQTLGIERAQNEDDKAFKDRVYGVVEERNRQAQLEAVRRGTMRGTSQRER